MTKRNPCEDYSPHLKGSLFCKKYCPDRKDEVDWDLSAIHGRIILKEKKET